MCGNWCVPAVSIIHYLNGKFFVVTQDRIRIDRVHDGQYTIASADFQIHSDSITVQLEGEQELTAFAFSDEMENPYTLGDARGTVFTDTSNTSGVQVKREIFVSGDGKRAAIRFAIKNLRDSRMHFNGINILEIDDDASLSVGGGTMAAWKMLRYPFHKNDIPSYFRPTTVDKDFEDAVFSCVGAVPGQGVLYNRLNVGTRTISSGPVLIIRNTQRKEAPLLMLCTMGIEKHFMEMFLTTTDDRQHLASFTVECNFDGIAIDPGEEVNTHWLLISTANHESDLLDVYTGTVAARYNLPPVKRPPLTVYCSWYFYTFNMTEQHVLEELTEIKKKKIPLDVFQIDDGWMNNYGSYQHDPTKFPNGMAFAAKKIKEAGMVAGIWSCPFVIEVDSPILENYPDIHQIDKDGNAIIYDTSINDCYVVDPTSPKASEYFEEIFTRFKEWGYRYFKIDWLRSMYEFNTVRFRNPKVNRAMAYTMALQQIRKILDPDCYVTGCGGLSDPGNFGLVNAQRTCKDVRGIWRGPEEVNKSGAIIHLKQNLLRSYINRFYHSDPDGTQIRIRKTPFFENERKCVGVYQSEGHYTDEEAFTICAQQYLCGGLVMISERFPELQEHRLAMLRHIAPVSAPPARIIDFDTPVCPTLFLTEVTPTCSDLDTWWTLTVGNWEDESVTRTLRIGEEMLPAGADRFAAFEFRTQEFMGVFGRDDEINVIVPAHAVRVVRLTPWDDQSPKILGTDCHITGGACEIAECSFSPTRIDGTVAPKWDYPVVVTAGFPEPAGSAAVVQATVPAGRTQFSLVKMPKDWP